MFVGCDSYAPPLWQFCLGGLDVPLSRHDHRAIQNTPIHVGLAGETLQRVLVALDFVTGDLPVEHREVNTTSASAEAELVTNECVLLGAVRLPKVSVQGQANVAVAQSTSHTAQSTVELAH